MSDFDLAVTAIANGGSVVIEVKVRQHNSPSGDFILVNVTPSKARDIASVILTAARQADEQMPAMPQLDPPP